MEANKKTFDINPGTGIMDVLGHTGYTFNEAIADIIDNSISSKASAIEIHFSIDTEEPFLYILDNGNGMSFDELKSSAIIGNKKIEDKREEYDLGRFSTGLKSATKSFCDDVIISSKALDAQNHTINIDYNYIKNTNKWQAFEVDNFEFENKIENHGTLIYCNKLHIVDNNDNKDEWYKKIDSLNNSLSHVFGMFLLEEGLKIYIQVGDSMKNEVIGWNPFGLLENKSTRVLCSDKKELNGQTVYFKSYILPTYDNLSQKDKNYMLGNGLINQEGFYVYRNNRLIVDGGWLSLEKMNLDDKSKYARIRVDFPSSLDKEFKINFSKTKIEIPEELKKTFVIIAKQARTESRTSFNYLKNPEIKRNLKKNESERLWNSSKNNGATVLFLNEKHPTIKEMLSPLSESEIKKFCTFISKSLPIALIQGQEISTVSYTENELRDLMEQTYNAFKKKDMDISLIKREMSRMEPYKDYINILLEFFTEKEDDD